MQSSRFQLGVIAVLALGLGLSISSSDAVGYPSGAAVSTGSNPVWSIGGDMGGGDHTVVTAESGDLIITDVSLSAVPGAWWYLSLSITDGVPLASFAGENLQIYPLHRTFSSGIRVPQGESLLLSWHASSGSSTGYRYTLSGYYAQP